MSGPKSRVEQTTPLPQPAVDPPLVVVVVVVDPPPLLLVVEPESPEEVEVVLSSQPLLAHVLVPSVQSSLPDVLVVVVPEPEDPPDVSVEPPLVVVVVVVPGSMAMVQPSVDELFPRHRMEISTPCSVISMPSDVCFTVADSSFSSSTTFCALSCLLM